MPKTKNIKIDFDEAIRIINSLLRKEKPLKFGSSWIYQHSPKVYAYVWKHIRTELGDIDWDKIVCRLDSEFQRRWTRRRAKRVKTYRNIAEVKITLKPYREKLYVFLSPADEVDKRLRDTISIALVRVAQKGNLRARQELVTLLRYIVDQWIEYCPRLWQWKGYTDSIQEKLEGCIRCYRFTGSFIGYLFKTLEYAGRGLRPMHAYSLDENHPVTEKRKIDSVVQDSETGEIRLYDRVNCSFH